MQLVTMEQIRKRDGRVVPFDKRKIVNAILKAIQASGGRDVKLAERLADKVVNDLEIVFAETHVPSVEDVQDIVERVLIEEGHAKTAKTYIIYRQERRRIREEKKKILQKVELDEVDKSHSLNALRVLASRYLLKDLKGNIIESPKQLYERVATTAAIPDILRDKRIYNNLAKDPIEVDGLKKYYDILESYDRKIKIGQYILNKWHFESLVRTYEELAKEGRMKISFEKVLELFERGELNEHERTIKKYYDIMAQKEFLPNSPTLMNAGTRLGQLSACFVLDVNDDLNSIMKAATDAALIFKSGGGVGVNYSKLRPLGDIVASTSGVASGPNSFMKIIDTVTDVVKQGGRRRGANMGIIEVWHPDVEAFITAKQTPGVLENFNVSVGIWEDFWDALKSDNGNYILRSPRNGEPATRVNPKQLLELIAFSAWKSAEPGVLFLDLINKYNVLKPVKGVIRTTNPCGEQPLYPYESCNLGSINLAALVKLDDEGRYEFDWEGYEEVIRLTTRFLDNIIDVNKYPIPEIDENTRATRKIGLGIMGLADLLFKLEVQYNSRKGYELMNKLAEALEYYSMDESMNLAKERRPFPLYNKSEYQQGKLPMAGYYEISKSEHHFDWDTLIQRIKINGIRNSMTTTIAPSGTISMIADTSNGVEPSFALVFEKHVTVGKFYYVDSVFERSLTQRDMYSDEVLETISANYGSIKGLEMFPEETQRVFVTAMDIHWSDHSMAQAVWQKWINASISKTINMPSDVTVEDVKNAYLLAYELGLKGVTVYRDESRHAQVLHITSESKRKRFEVIPSEYMVNWINTKIRDPALAGQLEKIARLREKPTYAEPIIPNQVKTSEEILVTKRGPASPISEDYEKCPICTGRVIHEAGCATCLECGWSECPVS